MLEMISLLGWNQLIAVLMAAVVWLVCRTRMLSRRPALCHSLWLLVLLKVVTPPIFAVPVLPATVLEAPREAKTTPVAAACVDCSSTDASIAGNDVQPIRGQDTFNATNPFASPNAGSLAVGCATQPIPPDSSSAAQASVVPPSPPVDSPPGSVPVPWSRVFIALAGVSLFVTCLIWIITARRTFQLRRLLGSRTRGSDRALGLLREISRLFHLRTVVKLRIVDAPVTPMLWAVPGRPVIVLPRELIDSLDDDGLRNIIAHELGHYVRRDHWVNLFSFAATSVLWWHPVVWLARREISAAAEASCDAVALERLPGSRKSYARTLLNVVDSMMTTTSPRAALAITFGQSHSLRRRFQMIADDNVKPSMTRGGWVLLVLGLAVLALAPVRAEEAETAESKAAPPVVASNVNEKVKPLVSMPKFGCPPPADSQDGVAKLAESEASEAESTDANPPTGTPAENEVIWDEARDGWQVGMQLLSSSHHLDPGDPIVLQFLLRNVTDDERTIVLYGYGPTFHTLGEGHEMSLHISSSRQRWRHAVAPGGILRERRYRIAVGTSGLPPGKYTITRLTPFWTPGTQANTNEGISFRASVPVTIGDPSAVSWSDPPEVEGEAKIYWGKPVSGLVIGLQLPDGQSVWSDHAEIEAQLYAVNVSGKPIELEYQIPSDTWQQHVETEEGKYMPLKLLRMSGWRIPVTRDVTLQPGEVTPLSGIEAEVAVGSEANVVTKRITSPTLRIRLEGTEYVRSDAPALLTDGGSYRWYVSVSATQPRIPDLSMLLTTGAAPLEVK